MRRTYLKFAVVSMLPIVALGVMLGAAARSTIEARAADVYGSTSETMFGFMGEKLLSSDDFAAPMPKERLELFDSLINDIADSSDGGSVKVRFLKADGTVQFSTESDEIGRRIGHTEASRRALDGHEATRFADGGPGSIIENGTKQVEIFLPVQFADGPVSGIIQAAGIDPTLAGRIDGDVRRLRVALGIGLFGLWVVMLPIFAGVSRRLRTQSADNEHLAFHDTLTGLPNRNLLDDRLTQAVRLAQRNGDMVGLLVIDLDGFKIVNDTLGHSKGDKLLQQVAAALDSSLRSSDTVARLGGDEFAVIVPAVGSLDEVSAVAERVTAALAEPFMIEDIEVAMEASIGIAVLPVHGSNNETLLQKADIAMYAAKGADVSHVMYSEEIDSHSPTRLPLAADLRRALDEGGEQLELYFQPEVSTRSGRTEVMEALVRWNHPQRGQLQPADFIGMAEQSGLVCRVTAKVLDFALAEVSRWMDLGLHCGVAVNLSARDLRSFDIVHVVQDALAHHGVPASRLELEVTETALLLHPETAVQVLHELQGLGAHIALDDFGTGYSSLTYIKRLAPDRIKIDRSFVNSMIEKPTDATIVETLIGLAHRLDIGITAEGVETQAQFTRLTERHCDLVQGFYLTAPLPSHLALVWLMEHQPSTMDHTAGVSSSSKPASPGPSVDGLVLKRLHGR